MADQRWRRREAPIGTLIGPLAMLAGGAVAGVMLWRLLTLEPAPPAVGSGSEQLSRHDRQALERVLQDREARP